MDLGGYPVVLSDTAGLRVAGDEVEQEGVRRALAHAGAADLKLILFDGAIWPERDPATAALADANSLIAVNKVDLGAKVMTPAVGVSALTGDGLTELEARLTAEVAQRFAATAGPALTRARHRVALVACREALARFEGAAQPELAAEDLRLAARALGRITGRVDVEDVLDVIFAEFCIGK